MSPLAKDGKVLLACSYDGNVAAINFSSVDLGHSLSFVEKDKLFKVTSLTHLLIFKVTCPTLFQGDMSFSFSICIFKERCLTYFLVNIFYLLIFKVTCLTHF
jgi:hypothetical protein